MVVDSASAVVVVEGCGGSSVESGLEEEKFLTDLPFDVNSLTKLCNTSCAALILSFGVLVDGSNACIEAISCKTSR